MAVLRRPASQKTLSGSRGGGPLLKKREKWRAPGVSPHGMRTSSLFVGPSLLRVNIPTRAKPGLSRLPVRETSSGGEHLESKSLLEGGRRGSPNSCNA